METETEEWRREMRRNTPRRDHTTATAMMMNTSRPSRKNASHKRSCVWNGTELANKVMYHFVA